MLNRNVTPYEVSMIQLCTKLGRHIETPAYEDNVLDGVNYLAFVGTFAGQHFDGLSELRRQEIIAGMEEALRMDHAIRNKPLLTEAELEEASRGAVSG